MSLTLRTRMTHSYLFISVWPCSRPSQFCFITPGLKTYPVRVSPPPPPLLSLVPCESHEQSCLADAVKFKHFFFFTVWILGRLLFLRSCILFSPEWRPSEKRLLVITLVWALVTLRSSFSLIFAVYCFLIS